MGLVSSGPVLYPTIVSRATLGSVLLDAAGESAAVIFQAPKTGSIDRVCFRTGTVTVGATVDVRLETVSATTGDPTGTLWGTATNGSRVIADTDDNLWIEVTLTATASVTRGDLIALVVVAPTGANLNIARNSTSDVIFGFPFTDHFTTVWNKATASPITAVRYSDGDYPFMLGCLPLLLFPTNVSLASNTTPDEVGNRIELPMAAVCEGLWFGVAAATPGGDWTVLLYDSANNVLASRTVDKDQSIWTVGNPSVLRWAAPVTLTPGTYRVTIRPDTTTASNYIATVTVPSGLMVAMPQGDRVYRTHRTDAGAWADVATERTTIGLWLSDLDDGSRAAGILGSGAAAIRASNF